MKTIGIVAVAFLAARTKASPLVTMTSTGRRTNSGAISAARLAAPAGPAILDPHVATFSPAKFGKPLHKSGATRAIGCFRVCSQVSDGR
jgi:hypothetical protein